MYIKQFPSIIEHCIKWSKDKFDNFFYQDLIFLKGFLINPNENLQNISLELEEIKLEKMKKIYMLFPLV